MYSVGWIHSSITLFWFLFFVGVCIWAFLPSSKQRFEQNASIPFVDEEILKRSVDDE